MDERLQNAPWHTVDGVHYGVPYQWGPNVLAYNTDVFKEAPKSWSVVFEEQKLPDGKSNKGRVQAYDGPIYIADAAVYLMKKKPELGIKNPYELTPDQYAAAVALLQAQRALVGRYWHDAMVQVDDFKNEGVVASSSWPFQVNLLATDKKPVASTIPEEGATGWADTTMMHADAKHPNCAYKWLEHSLSPKVQGDVAAWFGSVPVGAGGLQRQRAVDRYGLRDQRLRQFREDLVLAHADGQVRAGRQVRALLAMGEGLHRHSRQVTRPTKFGPAFQGRAAPAMAQPMSPAVKFVNVCRHFGPVRAVDGVTLDIAEGEFFAMLGPSGSGKTTCLRLIAGFEQPTEGHIEIFGETAEGVPPYKRNVNTVFQDYALFPHMTVGENVAYGLMIKGVPRAEREAQGERRARHGQARRI